MPFGGLLSAGVVGGSSLLSGLFGGKAASKAAQQQQQELQQGINQTGQAVTSGQAGVTNATTAGQGLLSSATAGGLQSLANGTAGANSQLGTSLQSIRSLLSPQSAAGASATGGLQSLAGPNGQLSQQFSFNPSDLSKDPGYAFTLQQGQQAIQRAAAAQGGLFSGGTLKSLANYTTGTADQYFNDAFNRAQSTFNTNRQGALSQAGILGQLANLGSNATSQEAGATGQTASQIAQNLFGGGQFGANFGLQGANANAGLGLTGATTNANIGLSGANSINQLLAGIGNAKAAGTVGSTDSWLNALQQGTNGITGWLNRSPYGGGWSPFGGVSAGDSLDSLPSALPTGYSGIYSGLPAAPPPTVGGGS